VATVGHEKEIPAMKIQTIHSKTISDNKLVVAFDVGKDKLNAYCEYGQHCFQDSFANNTLKIEQKLITFSGIAESTGYEGLRIIAEPTGIYPPQTVSYSPPSGASHCHREPGKRP